MISAESKQTIESLCREVDKNVVADFFSYMDDDYFATFSCDDISKHIRLSASLSASKPVAANITPLGPTVDEFKIVIVGFDYPSQFSIFCGLLSAFGLDIREGDIYSTSRRGSRPSSRKSVDVFRVAVKTGESFDLEKQREFEEELQTLGQLLAAESAQEARERLNRFLVERIEKMHEELSGLLSPIEIEFDNNISSEWTVIETHAEDVFAFLYAFSNAMAMRGIYIHKVKIRGSGREAVDQFFVADGWGRKIEDPREQTRLKMGLAMIKQFTRFLPKAPDPAKAMRHFDQFLDKVAEQESPDRILSFFARVEGMELLAHLLGSSDFLWEDFLRIHFAELVSTLQNLAIPDKDSMRRELKALLAEQSGFDDKKKALNTFKDHQVFLIDTKHLLQRDATLTEFSDALTNLAEVVIDESVNVCRERLGNPEGRFTACGLGKFGGREMGYASDLELIFVHEGSTATYDALAHLVVDFIEARSHGIFHIDLRLRPYGDAGLWSTPIEQFEHYYRIDGEAAAFERQALIKLRWVSGDPDLGRRVEAHRDRFTYGAAQWDWVNALHLRQRQTRELVKAGQVNVKYSAGGIVDIEYAVQYLQLLNGSDYAEIRLPNTLEAMNRLRRLQIIREADYLLLHSAYVFLRNLIDALRIVRGDASDLVLPPETSEEFKSLARRLGYSGERSSAAARLAGDVRETMKGVNDYFLLRFGKGN